MIRSDDAKQARGFILAGPADGVMCKAKWLIGGFIHGKDHAGIDISVFQGTRFVSLHNLLAVSPTGESGYFLLSC